MAKVYKYRSNVVYDANHKKRDLEQLFSLEFYASNLQEMNDPFEGTFSFGTISHNEEKYTKVIQQISSLGIYSLAIDENNYPNNDLMWAHYANAHKGFCIEYDLDLLVDTINKDDYLGQIQIDYTNERPLVESNMTLNESIKSIVGKKSQSWSYEKELRLLFHTRGIKKINNILPITGVYFGLNMDSLERQQIIAYLKDKNVKYYQMERVDGTYDLKATEIISKFEYSVISINKNSVCSNYIILYHSSNKDKNSLIEFHQYLRNNINSPSNITVIDDKEILPILNKFSSETSSDEYKKLQKHWLLFSTFDAPDVCWVYPERLYYLS